MKIYDISQEVFSCEVYPGDPVPEKTALKSMQEGEVYNLTAFSMCAHNGTHIDAPIHFINIFSMLNDCNISLFKRKEDISLCLVFFVSLLEFLDIEVIQNRFSRSWSFLSNEFPPLKHLIASNKT